MSMVFEEHSTIDAWDRDYYDPISSSYYDAAVATMLRLMQVEKEATVLDAGCGPGVHSIRVASAGFKVCAIDISQEMLHEAKRRVTDAGLERRVEFRQDDLTKLSFPNSSFRYAFSWGVVIHIPEIEKALDELSRIIEPRGTLAIYLTNKDCLDQKIEGAARTLMHKKLDVRQFDLGKGVQYQMNGHELWLWQFDIPAFQKSVEKRGFRMTHRVAGEFSEIQRHTKGVIRRSLLRLNNLYYSLKLSPSLASTNLLIFQKT